MRGLQLDELAHQRVVFRVRNGRVVLDVIAVIVLFDLAAQARGDLLRIFRTVPSHGHENTRSALGPPAVSPACSSCPYSTCSRWSMTASLPSCNGRPWSSTKLPPSGSASWRPTCTMRPNA